MDAYPSAFLIESVSIFAGCFRTWNQANRCNRWAIPWLSIEYSSQEIKVHRKGITRIGQSAN